jgi:guanosine-3',5'-bis(diphosphate) 3'-pyrophosphohydrolase
MAPLNDLALILRAAHFAADKHRMQRRKDVEASPYINHPLALAYILSSEGLVTDADKSLPKEERKRLQVVKAASKSDAAKLVKLADKISNLRDIAASPPADWSRERRENYFRWAKQVVDGLRGVNLALETAFDEAYEQGLRSMRSAA